MRDRLQLDFPPTWQRVRARSGLLLDFEYQLQTERACPLHILTSIGIDVSRSLGQLEERGLIDEDRHAKQLADDPFYNSKWPEGVQVQLVQLIRDRLRNDYFL